MNSSKAREAVAGYMLRLYERNLTTSSGGNVSILTDLREIAISPSGKDKSKLLQEDIAIVDYNLNSLTPGIKISMETGMHTAVYKARPDISAIVHAHPPTATSFAASNEVIRPDLTGETDLLCSRIEIVPYFKHGTPELAEAASKSAEKSDCLLLKNHGALTLGKTIHEAFAKMEVLEQAAIITLNTSILGSRTFIEQTEY